MEYVVKLTKIVVAYIKRQFLRGKVIKLKILAQNAVLVLINYCVTNKKL